MDHIQFDQIPLDILIGNDPEELAAPQRIMVSLDLGISPRIMRRAAKTDQLEEAVDFKPIVEMVRRIGSEKHRALLETLAEEIAASALHEFPIDQIIVMVEKPHRYGTLEGISVRIERHARKRAAARK